MGSGLINCRWKTYLVLTVHASLIGQNTSTSPGNNIPALNARWTGKLNSFGKNATAKNITCQILSTAAIAPWKHTYTALERQRVRVEYLLTRDTDIHVFIHDFDFCFHQFPPCYDPSHIKFKR